MILQWVRMFRSYETKKPSTKHLKNLYRMMRQSHGTSVGSDVQDDEETSEESVPDDEANGHDTSAGSDVQENLKEIGDSDEHPSGHSSSVNNATENG